MDSQPPEQPERSTADEISDQIRKAVHGDASALDHVVEWLSPLMIGWARSIFAKAGHWPIQPDDLVQDVWVRLLPYLPDLKPHAASGDRFTPALFGVVKTTLRNRALDIRRDLTRRRLLDESGPEPANPSSGPFSKALRSERRSVIERALERIPDRDRALYLQRIFGEASLEELMQEFDMSRDAVIKARQRVRKKLAEYLEPRLLDELEG